MHLACCCPFPSVWSKFVSFVGKQTLYTVAPVLTEFGFSMVTLLCLYHNVNCLESNKGITRQHNNSSVTGVSHLRSDLLCVEWDVKLY